jgi:cytochrome c
MILGALTVMVLLLTGSAADAATGDPENGAQVFRVCAPCHTLVPGEHRTGPSLAGVWRRKAGTAPGFSRYSPALRSAGVVWHAQTLDGWLADPKRFIPGNRMIFPGLPDEQARADLIAWLEQASAQGSKAAQERPPGGMMGGGEMADLRRDVGPDNRVTSVRYCGDTYTVDVESGESHQFWEFNLRFKTDSSSRGPERSHPVLIPSGMSGDRAFVIFSAPEEISGFIKSKC